MTERSRSVANLAILTLTVALLAGCAAGITAPSRFYILTAQAKAPMPTAGTSWNTLSIGVGPVEVASYLDRTQIVSRGSDSVLELGEFDRWAEAEPLDRGIPRVMLENLAIFLNSKRLTLMAQDPQTPVDCQLVARITGFDGTLGNQAVLTARWMLLAGDQQHIVQWEQTTIKEPTAGGGYQALVEAQSRALAELCRQIASAMESWRKQ